MSDGTQNACVFEQLQQLAECIARARAELSLLKPSEMKLQFIPRATDELDAIVEATATATHRIMDAADAIMEVQSGLAAADRQKLSDAVTSIFEACTFQDITGQRVTKIVSVLKVIEGRVDQMIEAVGGLVTAGPEEDSALDSAQSQDEIDALMGSSNVSGSTLEGPALPGQGSSQEDVDALLAGVKS